MTDAVFVGRKDELARFAALLRDLPAAERVRRWRRTGQPPGDLDGAARSRVVLVHGLGGSGKSRLLDRFRAMANGSLASSPVSPGWVRTAWLDWEDEQRDQPGLYAGLDGPNLVTVLDALQRAITAAFAGNARACEGAAKAFAGYRQGAARMPEYAARFADVHAQVRQVGSPFTARDAAALQTSAASAGLVLLGHPGGMLGLSPDQLAASATAAGHLSEAAVRAVTGRNPAEIPPEEYALVTDPGRELTRRVAAAVRGVAELVPLVVLLDTGEIIGDRAWDWLCRVMTQTGPRVIWVVGARFSTEAEAGPASPVARFVRDIGDALARMSPTRFDHQMITEYVASRTGRNYSGADIGAIARFTTGLPLAVSLTAQLLSEGQSVEEICQERGEGHPDSVVSALARRYLIHAEKNPYPAGDSRSDDLMKILTLALAYGDLRDDPDLLATLWNVVDPLAALADLASRHDFVLIQSRRLHDDVRDTLRADLLDPYRRVGVRAISEKAAGFYRARVFEMSRRWPTLDEQLDHAAFTTAVLAMLWHVLWVDNQAGLDLFARILPLLAIADKAGADSAVRMLDVFSGMFSHDQKLELDLLTETIPIRSGGLQLERRIVNIGTSGLTVASRRWNYLGSPDYAANFDYLIGQWRDRKVAEMILRADLQARDHDDKAATDTLRRAAIQNTSSRLQAAIGSKALAIARRLIWSGPNDTPIRTTTGLAAAKLATDMLPGSVSALNSFAAALDEIGNHQLALAAYGRARALWAGNTSTIEC